MNKRELRTVIFFLVLAGIFSSILYFIAPKDKKEKIIPVEIKKTEIYVEELIEDSIKFVSQIQEQWNFITKNVYRDFLDQNVLQSSNFSADTIFNAQVIRLYQRNNLEKDILQLDKYQNLEALSFVECYFKGTQLKKLIDILKDKKHFKKLMISHSNIKSIPSNICELKSLETLDFSHNKLTKINDTIACLTRLKYLGLRSNKSLKKLSKEIGNLRNLQLLDISACSIDSIPNTIGQCLELKALHANAGKLEYVPNSIGNCQKMINLNIGHNRISNLPNGIGRLKNLGMLSVSYNRHDSIPVSYRNLTKLFNFN